MSLLDDTEVTPSNVYTLKENEIALLNLNLVGIFYIKKKIKGWEQNYFILNFESNNLTYWNSYPSKKRHVLNLGKNFKLKIRKKNDLNFRVKIYQDYGFFTLNKLIIKIKDCNSFNLFIKHLAIRLLLNKEENKQSN